MIIYLKTVLKTHKVTVEVEKRKFMSTNNVFKNKTIHWNAHIRYKIAFMKLGLHFIKCLHYYHIESLSNTLNTNHRIKYNTPQLQLHFTFQMPLKCSEQCKKLTMLKSGIESVKISNKSKMYFHIFVGWKIKIVPIYWKLKY